MAKEVDHTGNTIMGIMLIAVLTVVLLLACVLVFGALSTADISQNGRITGSQVNETEMMNGTLGYLTLSKNSLPSPVCTIAANGVNNASNGNLIGAGNYTQSNCLLLVGTVDIGLNNTNWNVSYSWTSTNTTTNAGIVSVQTNVVAMVSNFFALAPTIGTILAVVVLIAGIVILVMYVSRMKNSGTVSQGSEGYTG